MKLKLSEAILLGSTQIQLAAANWDTCAFGAAKAAIGKQRETWYSLDFEREWPWTAERIGQRSLPCGCEGVNYDPCANLMGAITHVFDNHVMRDKTWSLEKLVDWVRSIEPSAPADAPLTNAQLEGEDFGDLSNHEVAGKEK